MFDEFVIDECQKIFVETEYLCLKKCIELEVRLNHVTEYFSQSDNHYIVNLNRIGQHLIFKFDYEKLCINLFEEIYGEIEVHYDDFSEDDFKNIIKVLFEQFICSSWHNFMSDCVRGPFSEVIEKYKNIEKFEGPDNIIYI